MSKLTVMVTRRWPPDAEARLSKQFATTLNASDDPMSENTLRGAFFDYDVICPTVSDRITAAVIGTTPRTRLIANFGAGVDHIDLDACRRANIRVTNTPDVLTEATADLAMGLMLAAARRMGAGERQLRAGRWRGWGPTDMLGSMLSDKTLGFVGFGRIALATARRAHFGFGMNIRYFSRSEKKENAEALSAVRDRSLDDLLRNCDIVSINVPGGAETVEMIGERELSLMKPGSILINTARGSVIDYAALVRALRDKRIGAAGLDVYPAEPAIPDGLTDLENVVLLPHLGSATLETRTAMGFKAAENVEAFVRGDVLPDIVC